MEFSNVEQVVLSFAVIFLGSTGDTALYPFLWVIVVWGLLREEDEKMVIRS